MLQKTLRSSWSRDYKHNLKNTTAKSHVLYAGEYDRAWLKTARYNKK